MLSYYYAIVLVDRCTGVIPTVHSSAFDTWHRLPAPPTRPPRSTSFPQVQPRSRAPPTIPSTSHASCIVFLPPHPLSPSRWPHPRPCPRLRSPNVIRDNTERRSCRQCGLHTLRHTRRISLGSRRRDHAGTDCTDGDKPKLMGGRKTGRAWDPVADSGIMGRQRAVVLADYEPCGLKLPL